MTLRIWIWPAACVLSVGLLAPRIAHGEEVKPEAEKRPVVQTLATDEDVDEALERFVREFKARGVPREEVQAVRASAMKQLAKLQHPDIIAALGKITKGRDEDLRVLALIYLGDQTLSPYLAAKPILASMKKNKRDATVLITCLQSLGALKYLGARKEIATMLKHMDFAVKKVAIASIAVLGDLRMLEDIVRLLGVRIDAVSSQRSGAKEAAKQKDRKVAPGTTKGKGKAEGETADEGYSWEGVDVFVPKGEDPERMVREAQEKNRKEAEAAAAARKAESERTGGSSPSVSETAGSTTRTRKGGVSRRGIKELIPVILVALHRLTGEKFTGRRAIGCWFAANAAALRASQAVLDDKEKAQKRAASTKK